MPPLSDPPYPFNCLLSGFASTFERYQRLKGLSPARAKEEREKETSIFVFFEYLRRVPAAEVQSLKTLMASSLSILRQPTAKDRVHNTPNIVMFLNQIQLLQLFLSILNTANRKFMTSHIFG